MSILSQALRRISDRFVGTVPENSDATTRPVTYTILDYITQDPYLTRTVFPRVFGLRPLLHHFHRADVDRALHNHPWRWSLSIILCGSYVEERLGQDGRIRTRHVRFFNTIRDDDFHRITELRGEVWTLFFAGPRTQGWGFLDRGAFVPHKTYIQRARA